MDTTREVYPGGSNLFDLDSLDQDSYEAAPQAIANELLRIAEKADISIVLLNLPYQAHISGTESERQAYDLEIAALLEQQADDLSSPQKLAAILQTRTGMQARQRVFLNTFHGLDSMASADDLIQRVKQRQEYMTTLRTVRGYNVTLREFYAIQETVAVDETVIDMSGQTDVSAFRQLLSLKQEYQGGHRNG